MQPPPNQSGPRPSRIDGVWLAVACIAGAGVGGILGSFSPSLAGIIGGGVYLSRRSGRRMTVRGVVVDSFCLLVCALLSVWGLRDWELLNRWGLLPNLPAASQYVYVVLFRGLAGALGGLILGAALGSFGRR
jgi:hypothetical protein